MENRQVVKKALETSSILIRKVHCYTRIALVKIMKESQHLVMSFKDTSIEFRKRLLSSVVFMFLLLFVISVGNIIYGLMITILCVSMVYEIIKICRNIANEKNRISIRRISIVCIIFCCISMIFIRQFSQGFKITIWMFFVVWSVDTFAYIFGKKYGKVPLSPISPNKTYEGAVFGTIGGSLVSMVLYSIFYMHTESSFSGISFFILTIVVVILAQAGDLTESYVKRQCGVKDSGKFLPGHGGACDRFDSLLYVAPFVFFVVLLNGGALF